MSATEMHDDEVRARLGLEPLGRPMTMEERITMLNLRAMPEPHDEAELVDTVASQLNPDDDAPQCGEAFDHDEEIVYEDGSLIQWLCRRCGAEGWNDKDDEENNR